MAILDELKVWYSLSPYGEEFDPCDCEGKVKAVYINLELPHDTEVILPLAVDVSIKIDSPYYKDKSFSVMLSRDGIHVRGYKIVELEFHDVLN